MRLPLLTSLMACFLASSPEPPQLPSGTARVTIDGEHLVVNGEEVVGFRQLEVDPVDAVDPLLRDALQGAPAVWLPLPADTAWYRVRKVVGSAEAAGVPAVWLSTEGSPPRVQEGPARGVGLKMSCRGGPMAFTDVVPRVTMSLQRSADGIWGIATASFLPVIDGRPTDGLPARCIQPRSCSDLYTGPAADACEAGRRGEPAPSRVSLGGDVGCLLPLLRQEGDLAMWDRELPAVLKHLGLSSEMPVVVSPEARIRYDVVVAALAGFDVAGLPVPSLGKPLVEGNDGAPLCTAEVRSAEALELATARYAGSLMRQEDG